MTIHPLAINSTAKDSMSTNRHCKEDDGTDSIDKQLAVAYMYCTSNHQQHIPKNKTLVSLLAILILSKTPLVLWAIPKERGVWTFAAFVPHHLFKARLVLAIPLWPLPLM